MSNKAGIFLNNNFQSNINLNKSLIFRKHSKHLNNKLRKFISFSPVEQTNKLKLLEFSRKVPDKNPKKITKLFF